MTTLRLADTGGLEANPNAIGRSTVAPPIRGIALSGLIVLVIAASLMTAWSALVPLSGGVVASGQVVVEANRRHVQSRYGGTIDVLRVKEGSFVQRGDIVLSFDATEAKANHAVIDHQYLKALTTHARLTAEVGSKSEIRWPEEIKVRVAEQLVGQLVQHETEVLRANNEFFEGRRSILQSRLKELNNRADALKAQIKGLGEQQGLTKDEEADVANLVQRGYERRPRLLELRRDLAELTGQLGAQQSSLSAVLEAKEGVKRELNNLTNERMSRAFSELSTAESEIAQLGDQRRNTIARLQETDLRAPESGTVVDLKFFGPGAVVNASEPVFDLVPRPDEIQVRAKVRPDNVEVVRIGQEADIRVLAHSQRFARPISGTVSHLSADLLADRNNENPHYEVFITVNKTDLEERPEIVLQPGMPVDVVLKTEERTFFEYLVSPITRWIFLGFRED
jgi:HlyD family type I secretion membrane fusion protein